MSNASNYLENVIANVICRGSSYTGGNVYLALFSNTPTDAGGTEVTGNNYSRQQVTFSAPTDGVITNSGNVTFTPSSGNTFVVNGVGIYDASTSGNLLFWRGIGTQTPDSTNPLTFESGKLTITID